MAECQDPRHRIIDHEKDLQFAGPFEKDQYGDWIPQVAIVEGVPYTRPDAGSYAAWLNPDRDLQLYVEGDDDWDLWYAEVCPYPNHICVRE